MRVAGFILVRRTAAAVVAIFVLSCGSHSLAQSNSNIAQPQTAIVHVDVEPWA